MKPATPIKLERLIKLDELFRQEAAKRHTASSLGKELEVTERTIRNDIEFLRDRYYAPIDYTKIAGWHYTDLNWSLPTIPLARLCPFCHDDAPQWGIIMANHYVIISASKS
jgi:HTH domain